MANQRLQIRIPSEDRQLLARYKAFYGLSLSRLNSLALIEFFTTHPLPGNPQPPGTSTLTLIDQLLQLLANRKS